MHSHDLRKDEVPLGLVAHAGLAAVCHPAGSSEPYMPHSCNNIRASARPTTVRSGASGWSFHRPRRKGWLVCNVGLPGCGVSAAHWANGRLIGRLETRRGALLLLGMGQPAVISCAPLTSTAFWMYGVVHTVAMSMKSVRGHVSSALKQKVLWQTPSFRDFWLFISFADTRLAHLPIHYSHRHYACTCSTWTRCQRHNLRKPVVWVGEIPFSALNKLTAS